MSFIKVKEIIDRKPYIIGLLIITSIFVVYFSALDNYLLRDDFEWLNESYGAIENPSILFEKINNFFRPMVKLSYLFNHFFFKTNHFFYNLTTILIHLLNVFLLFILINKLGIYLNSNKNRILAITIAIGFGTSPMYSEVTLWAAGRPDSILLAFILSILFMYHKLDNKESFTNTNKLVLLLLTISAAFSKETWILLPFLILSFQIIIKRMKLSNSLKQLVPVLILWISYLVYFIGIPLLNHSNSPTNYSNASIGDSIRKFGFLVCKYFGFNDLYSGKLWEIILIILVLISLSLFFIYRKNRLALWGLSWMLITISISLPIYYAPSRYNYLPLMGFWIMIIGFIFKELEIIVKRTKINKKIIYLLIGTLFILTISNQIIMMQWEIKDYRFQSKPHKELSQMYLEIIDKLPHDKPIAFIDFGKRKTINEATHARKGYIKLLFARKSAIWQLVSIAPLHNFLTDSYDKRMIVVPKEKIKKSLSEDFSMLVFSDSAFKFNNSYRDRLLRFFKVNKKLPFKVQIVKITDKK